MADTVAVVATGHFVAVAVVVGLVVAATALVIVVVAARLAAGSIGMRQ